MTHKDDVPKTQGSWYEKFLHWFRENNLGKYVNLHRVKSPIPDRPLLKGKEVYAIPKKFGKDISKSVGVIIDFDRLNPPMMLFKQIKTLIAAGIHKGYITVTTPKNKVLPKLIQFKKSFSSEPVQNLFDKLQPRFQDSFNSLSGLKSLVNRRLGVRGIEFGKSGNGGNGGNGGSGGGFSLPNVSLPDIGVGINSGVKRFLTGVKTIGGITIGTGIRWFTSSSSSSTSSSSFASTASSGSGPSKKKLGIISVAVGIIISTIGQIWTEFIDLLFNVFQAPIIFLRENIVNQLNRIFSNISLGATNTINSIQGEFGIFGLAVSIVVVLLAFYLVLQGVRSIV